MEGQIIFRMRPLRKHRYRLDRRPAKRWLGTDAEMRRAIRVISEAVERASHLASFSKAEEPAP